MLPYDKAHDSESILVFAERYKHVHTCTYTHIHAHTRATPLAYYHTFIKRYATILTSQDSQQQTSPDQSRPRFVLLDDMLGPPEDRGRGNYIYKKAPLLHLRSHKRLADHYVLTTTVQAVSLVKTLVGETREKQLGGIFSLLLRSMLPKIST